MQVTHPTWTHRHRYVAARSAGATLSAGHHGRRAFQASASASLSGNFYVLAMFEFSAGNFGLKQARRRVICGPLGPTALRSRLCCLLLPGRRWHPSRISVPIRIVSQQTRIGLVLAPNIYPAQSRIRIARPAGFISRQAGRTPGAPVLGSTRSCTSSPMAAQGPTIFAWCRALRLFTISIFFPFFNRPGQHIDRLRGNRVTTNVGYIPWTSKLRRLAGYTVHYSISAWRRWDN